MNNEKKRFWGLTITQVTITLLLLITRKICFATNDDTTMVDIVSGGYGKCTPYIINIHILLGYVYKSLFQIFKSVNWVTVSYLMTYIFSGVLLNSVFSKKKNNYVIIYTVLNICYILVISYFSFTVVAYYAIIAGCIVLIYAMKMKNKKYYILGTIAVIIGALFRGEAIKSICIVIVAYVIYYFGKKASIKYIVLLAGLVAIMYGSIYSNLAIENINPVEKKHLEWGEIRSEALDCAPVPYNQEKFEKVGISPEQYLAMYNVFYYDYEHISTSEFEKLIKLNTIDNKYNFDIIQFFITYINRFKEIGSFSYIYFIVFWLVFVLFIIQCVQKDNKREIFALCICFTVILSDLVFFIIQRTPYRVIMPNYLLAILLFVFELEDLEIIKLSKKKAEYIVHVSILLLLLVVVGFRYKRYDLMPKYMESNERKSVLDYLVEHNEKIFMAGDTRVFSVDIGRSIWDYTARHGCWNIMGNWEIYGQAYYNLMDIYQIDNSNSLLLESLQNDNVEILTTFGDEFVTNYSYILSWMKQYYDIDVEFVKVDEITNVKISDDENEEWAVYRLKVIE